MSKSSHRILGNNNTPHATAEEESAYPFRESEFTKVLCNVPSQSLAFCVLFCESMFVFCSFFKPLYRVFFLDLRLLFTPFVSSNVFCRSYSVKRDVYFAC